MTGQLALPLRMQRGDIAEITTPRGLEFCVRGRVQVRVLSTETGWRVEHVGANCGRPVRSPSEGEIIARRIIRMLTA